MILCGCVAVPYPHRVTKYPEIKGKIIQNDQPAENLTVVLTKIQIEPFLNQYTQSREQTTLFEIQTKTDSNGEFVFSEKKKWQYFKYLILAPVDGTPIGTNFDLEYKIDSDEKLHSFPNSYQTTGICYKTAYIPIYMHPQNEVPKYNAINLGTIKIPNN